MDKFTIKDIENLSGIKAHAWRIWEQRYDIGVAQRKDSNHRIFDNENLKKVLRIAYLYHSGIKISKIAGLDSDTIKDWALKKLTEEGSFSYYVKELLEASVDLDEERFERTLDDAIRRLSLEEAMLK